MCFAMAFPTTVSQFPTASASLYRFLKVGNLSFSIVKMSERRFKLISIYYSPLLEMPSNLCYDFKEMKHAWMFTIFFLGFCSVILAQGGGCGYSLQRSQNSEFEKKGIRRVFVLPVVNNTFKAGAENLVYNAVVKKISAHRGVSLASRKEDADAVLKGTVVTASFNTDGATSADQLFGNAVLPPERRGSANISVATVFSATLGCSFLLERKRKPGEKPETLWTGTLSESRTFPGNNQIDVFGTTSALMNESEFDRALRELAESVSGDLYEAMFVLF